MTAEVFRNTEEDPIQKILNALRQAYPKIDWSTNKKGVTGTLKGKTRLQISTWERWVNSYCHDFPSGHVRYYRVELMHGKNTVAWREDTHVWDPEGHPVVRLVSRLRKNRRDEAEALNLFVHTDKLERQTAEVAHA